ncbi:hypothetical protein ACNH6C_11205 [Bdellovibrio bacteriovorus]|uniref:hypothetical protein n=1 Tax=Bdellovibrio bacteriovorus TaxID=959 RepID=UPI003A7FDE78
MRKVLVLLALGFGSTASAGGDWSEAKITKFIFNERAQVVFELEWIQENGFISKSEFKRFVFEFHNWPSSSHRWLHQALPWTDSDKKTYPLADVAACQNMLLDAYREGATIQLGQMGTVPFQPSALTKDAGVAPYAKVIEQKGVTVCLLYAAPI